MFKLFKKKKAEIVVATLNARLQPSARVLIEDKFDTEMLKQGHGIRVVGGGTLMESTGEVIYCDIEIELDDLSKATIDIIIDKLGDIMAPKGSRLQIFNPDRTIEFGTLEGLALYLNGTDLPDEVYRDCDSNFVAEECQRLLKGIGKVRSHWQGPKETAFYMYGADYETMHERLKSFLQIYPLCQKCRIVQIA